MSQAYIHHEITCAPRCWSEVAKEIQQNDCFKTADGKAALYGLWRSQIGLPRDVLSMISVWPDMETALSGSNNILCDVQNIDSYSRQKIILKNFCAFVRMLGRLLRGALILRLSAFGGRKIQMRIIFLAFY